MKEMMQIMDTSHKEIMAETKLGRDMEMMACREITEAHLEEKETIACQEEMEADAEKVEPDSEMMQSVMEHQDVFVQDATVMPVGEPQEETSRLPEKRRWSATRWRHIQKWKSRPQWTGNLRRQKKKSPLKTP
jgi:hypothetical protein